MVINWLNCQCCQTVVACSCFPSFLRLIVEGLVIDFPVFYFRSLLRCHRSALSITRWRWACLMPSWWSTRSSRYQVSLKRRHLHLTSDHLCTGRPPELIQIHTWGTKTVQKLWICGVLGTVYSFRVMSFLKKHYIFNTKTREQNW